MGKPMTGRALGATLDALGDGPVPGSGLQAAAPQESATTTVKPRDFVAIMIWGLPRVNPR